MAINKQPVFTTAPVLALKYLDPPKIVPDIWDPGSHFDGGDIIYTSTDLLGTLIERITVTNTGDPTNFPNVIEKLVYLYIRDKSGNWSLYKTGIIPQTTISDTTPNPYIEWVFTGGLLLPDAFDLYIGVSNQATKADYMLCTVEGSTYTQV